MQCPFSLLESSSECPSPVGRTGVVGEGEVEVEPLGVGVARDVVVEEDGRHSGVGRHLNTTRFSQIFDIKIAF